MVHLQVVRSTFAMNMDEPKDCVRQLFSSVIIPNAGIRSDYMPKMEQNVQQRVCHIIAQGRLKETVLNTWKNVIVMDGDASAMKYTRRRQLDVADPIKNTLAESCERWAAMLYRVAEVQCLVHGGDQAFFQ